MSWFLAVDGGNTKTDALVLDETGRVHGVGRSGTSDMYAAAGEAAAQSQLQLAIAGAVQAAGITVDQLGGAALRLAGMDWPEDETTWRHWSDHELGTEIPVSLANDGTAGLRSIADDGIGVALTVGTAFAVGARGLHGQTWSLDNWSQDQLGAIGLGRDAYRAVVRAELGLGPATILTARLLSQTEEPDVEALVHSVTRRNSTYTNESFALLAPTVTAAAGDGDEVATAITEGQAAVLTGYLGLAARQVGLRGAFTVLLDGSVIRRPGSILAAALAREVAVALPATRLVTSELSPVAGVALDVLVEAGITLSDEIRRRLSGHFTRTRT